MDESIHIFNRDGVGSCMTGLHIHSPSPTLVQAYPILAKEVFSKIVRLWD
jgi:hypothetical protein